jgi:hypothetical protein
MSFDFVDMPNLGVRIPASFKRMAELQSIHRDATGGYLDIMKLFLIVPLSPAGDLPCCAIAMIIK